MSQHISKWMTDFLGDRDLQHPDGRALYAYRCSQDEFESLARNLANCPPYSIRFTDITVRGFVLYAAEWWQRKYDGGTWAWEPLLESIGWQQTHYPDLYEPVKRAWRWWGVRLVRLPTSIRYLGTFACQGGLPLALVGDSHSNVTKYLRTVLRHVDSYRRFVDDPIALAQDKQHVLRPPTLRRDYVFRLAADLVEAVLDLRDDAPADDPLNALDRSRPGWRRTMPLALDDERARDLLTGLLREATRTQTTPSDEFRVERFLRKTGTGWRLGAKIRLPATLSAEILARHLKVRNDVLPPRLQVRSSGHRARTLGLYAAQGDDFLLLRDSRLNTEIWDSEAAGEIRLEFLAGGTVGEPLIPNRGNALGDLPWSFLGTDDCSLVGEGSVANRSPEILVLVPSSCRPSHGEALTAPRSGEPGSIADGNPEPALVLNRFLWLISEETEIQTENGRCVIRPASGRPTDDAYRISGNRFYDFESPWPLFCGAPRLRLSRAEQPPRAVPPAEVSWRHEGGDWQATPTGYGLWEMRHIRSGELRHCSRVGILPGEFSLSIEPGSDMSHGHLVLHNADAIRVAGIEPELNISPVVAPNAVRVEVRSRDTVNPPHRVRFRLHWAGTKELIVEASFPGQGARFLREGNISDNNFAVDDLYGIRAIALSPDQTQRYWIQGELKAPDAGGLLRVAHFRKPLDKTGVAHDLPLIDLRRMIELLLSASSSNDAHVALQILDRKHKVQAHARVYRFSAVLNCNFDIALVLVSPALDSREPPTLEAYPLTRPSDEPIAIDIQHANGAAHCAVLSNRIDLQSPWLLVMRHDEKIRVRPHRIGGTESVVKEHGQVPSLAEALAIGDTDLRTDALSKSMDMILAKETSAQNERNWSFLTESLLRGENLPATAFDLFKVLVTKPELLVRCLFRLETAPRQMLWRLDNQLPFSWLLIPRQVWRSEADSALVQLRNQLVGIMDDHSRIAREHVLSILSEGAKRYPGLETISTDCACRIDAGRLSSAVVNAAIKERDATAPQQIRLRARLDDWPSGYGRNEWEKRTRRNPVGPVARQA